MPITYDQAIRDIIKAGQRLDSRGLAPATSGNYSVRLGDGRIAITVSGKHKGRMAPDDIMTVDAAGAALEHKKPSAETLLHSSIYKLYPNVKAILHTHSVPSVALTKVKAANQNIALENYEMLKAFPGVETHETRIDIPVFENSQDIAALAREVEARLKNAPNVPGYLIKGHGLYVWGRDMEEAERVAEAMEYLLLCEVEMMKLKGAKA